MMKKILKWMGIVVGAIAGLILLVVAWGHLAGSRELAREYVVEQPSRLTIPTDPADIAEGKRLAATTGCLHCHGETLAGQMVHDFPNIARFVAPNVSAIQDNYSDAQLEAVIRRGVKSDGTGMLFMPAEMFHHMSDADVARLIAYLRTVPAVEGTKEKTEIRLLGRMLVAKGDFKTGPRALETMAAPVNAFDAGDPVSHGRHLVMNLCTECHSQDLEGMPIAHSPSLSVAKAYTAEQFSRLMREGTGTGERTFALMTPTSKARFAHLTGDEVQAIYAFLQSR